MDDLVTRCRLALRHGWIDTTLTADDARSIIAALEVDANAEWDRATGRAQRVATGAPEDLTTRCLAEVERVMADEPHTWTCGSHPRFDDSSCDCDRETRIAARLARMLAAATLNAAHIGWDSCGLNQSLTMDKVALRAIEALDE